MHFDELKCMSRKQQNSKSEFWVFTRKIDNTISRKKPKNSDYKARKAAITIQHSQVVVLYDRGLHVLQM